MTKAEELKILDEAIAKLGTDSYLGPWLMEVRGEVEHEIITDYTPSPTIANSKRLIREAMDERDQIQTKAHEWEKGFKDGVRERVRKELSKSIEGLTSFRFAL